VLRPASVKLLDTWEPRTVCEPATTTPWVPSRLHGTHAVGSVTPTEPTPPAKRGFGAINPRNPRCFGVSFSRAALAYGPRFLVL
jgi:hypothetical protein